MSTVHIDFSRTEGVMKPMHSVNNGPVGSGMHTALGNFEAYRAVKIPYARTHDAAFYAEYGGEHTVDIHRIFRNFDADPTDPASYHFTQTDRYLQSILAAGAKPFFRLGAAIEHREKLGTYPPKDFHKWAVICEHVIRHYNEGWADGFHMDIEYWEIWNEPECRNAEGQNPCWQGTDEQFIDLFTITLRHLKSCFPQLKIGGPALCTSQNDYYNELLFTRLQKEKLPLDFFSFHCYAKEPAEIAAVAEYGKKVLQQYGYDNGTELILNEWNYVKGWVGEAYGESMRTQRTLKAAAFYGAVLCMAQRSPLDHLMYYDARPSNWNGMFSPIYLDPLKGYYPFFAWGEMYALGSCVQSASDDPEVYCAAAGSDGEDFAGGVYVTRYADEGTAVGGPLRLELTGLDADTPVRAEVCVLDDTRDLQPIMAVTFTGSAALELDLPLYTGYYLRLKLQK